VECGKSKPSACENCHMKTKENMKFQNLYKQLIEDIVKNLE
jgi:formate-dependent nitrite reductase cytochrome c552 subunit